MSGTFTSPLLLSEESILQLGIKPHDVENFRRRQYQFSFGIHTWYKTLEKHTFKSEIFDLSYHEARAIVDLHRHQPVDPQHLLHLKNKLDDILATFPNGAFVKLDTRSPKDVPVYAFENEYVQYLVDAEIDKLSYDEMMDEDAKTAAFVRATNKYMKVVNGEEALNLLVLSVRVAQDLEKALEYGEILFKSKLVVREWLDEVPEHPEMEFRGFVHKNKLNALTQYFSFVRFPELVANKEKILQRMLTFFESVKHLITHESYVIDFFVLGESVRIIELNPFHNGAGAGLFSWKTDRTLFMEGPFEFRITEDPPNPRDPAEILPGFWEKRINARCEKRLHKPFAKILPVVLLATFGLWRLSLALFRART